MNKEYIVLGDKVVISDDGKLKEPIEYYDNIETILKQENKIEQIKKEIKKLEPILPYRKVKISKSLKYLLIGVAFSIFVSIPVALIFAVDTATFLELIIGLVAIGSLGSIGNYVRELDEQRSNECRKYCLMYLKKELKNQNVKLKSLKEQNIKTINHENQNKIIEVKKDDEYLKDLRKKINLYYNLGAKMKKYQELLEKGTLNEELLKAHGEEDATIIENLVIEEKQKELAHIPERTK